MLPAPSARIYETPVELLRALIRFDTTNPPGNERPLIEYIRDLLASAGIESELYAKTPERPNLVARLKGEGSAPPLLLYGHVDVVTTAGQQWTHPPFEAQLVDGYIWGRGALDMKHGITMYLAALLKAKAEGTRLPGDVIFVANVDEEVASEFGACYLVEEYADLFTGVRFALSEFGGTTVSLGGKRFYPIQVAEKSPCLAQVTFRAAGGHGAVPVHGGTMAKLGAALRKLDKRHLPVHITPETRLMVSAISTGLGGMQGFAMKQLLNPLFTDALLNSSKSLGRTFTTLLHNTVSPTMIQASDKFNVIPAEVVLKLDGRLLPGQTAEDLKRELQRLLGKDCSIEVHQPVAAPASADMSLYEPLAACLREFDPEAIPFPFVNYGATDARSYSRLGIQTYGFTPLLLKETVSLVDTIHSADERVPVEALEFGVNTVFKALQSFH